MISYDKGFFESNLKSTVSVQVDLEPEVTFVINTVIRNYPYKATLTSQIKFKSAELNKKAKEYFSTSQWLSSEMQVTLWEQLSGDVLMGPGTYQKGKEMLSNNDLNIHYSFNLKDQSGSFSVDLASFKATNASTNIILDKLFLSSEFNAKSMRAPSNYLLSVQDVRGNILSETFHLQDMIFEGDSKASASGDKINSTNMLKMASYQVGAIKNIYTDNEIQFNISNLDADTLEKLNEATENSADIEALLIELVQKGFDVDLESLKSTTPWGNVQGSLALSVQKGALLRNIMLNPFVLLDYVEGNADLRLADDFLKEPSFAFLLELALRSEILKKQDGQLILDAQLKQGELVVNGKNFPL